MYAPDFYAGYLSGVAYLVRTDVMDAMIKASLTLPIIHMDDVYTPKLFNSLPGRFNPFNFLGLHYGSSD